MPTEEQLQEGFTLGEWEIYPARGVLLRGDEEVRPEPQTWRVLLALSMRDGDLVSKEALVAEVWDGRPVTDDVINRAIGQVRKALDDDARAPAYVKTLHKRGYHLMQSVESHKPIVREELPAAAQPDVVPRRKTGWRSVAALLSVAVVVAWLAIDPPWMQPVQSIAVMRFQNLTGDPENDYIASGFKTELIASLTAIDNLMVKNLKRDYDLEYGEICERFRVERVLGATLRRQGNRLIVNYEIADTEGSVAPSGDIDGPADNLHELQKRLAERVSADLGGAVVQQLLKTRPSDSVAFNSYMRGMYELENRADRENLNEAVDLFRESIELDEHYGPAYLGLATTYALMVDYFDAPLDEFNTLAIRTIEEGIEKDPSITDAAGSIRGFVAHKEKRWEASEDSHLRAVTAELVDANAFNWYSRMLASVGRFDDALAQAQRAVEIEPSNAIANSRLAMMYTWLGDDREAYEYFDRAGELGAGGVNHLMANALLLTRNGQLEEARTLTLAGLGMVSAHDDWVDPVFNAMADSSLAAEAVASLNELDARQSVAPQASLITRAILGDTDGAMHIAQRLRAPGEIFEIELLFIPELAPLREHPGFPLLLDALNIPAYWSSRGCEWSGGAVECVPLVE